MRILTIILSFAFFSCKESKIDVTAISNNDKNVAFIYRQKNKDGLLDTVYQILIPAQFDYIEDWQVDNLIRIDSGGKRLRGGDVVGYIFKKYGLINTSGKILFRPQFDELIISDNSALVKQGGLYGFINFNGDWIVQPKYVNAYPFYKGTAVVKIGTQFSLINKQANQIIPDRFDNVYRFKNDIALVEKDKRWGMINYSGHFILPIADYPGLSEFNWYHGTVKKDDGMYYLIDTAGKFPIEEGFQEVYTENIKDTIYAIGLRNGKAIKFQLK